VGHFVGHFDGRSVLNIVALWDIVGHFVGHLWDTSTVDSRCPTMQRERCITGRIFPYATPYATLLLHMTVGIA
jgi:uncharacterized protein YcfJ